MKWTPDQLYQMLSASQNEPQYLYAVVRYLPHKQEDDTLFYYRHVFTVLDRQTPRQLMRIFPVSKEYDGARWQSKDYFHTMQVILEHGMDKPIGDSASFLWDYCNPHTRAFMAGFLCAVDRLRKKVGQSPMIADYIKHSGIAISGYRPVILNGKHYLQNTQDGSIVRPAEFKPKMPRWWSIIEGGKKEESHP